MNTNHTALNPDHSQIRRTNRMKTRLKTLPLIVTVLLTALVSLMPQVSRAHCDALDGPVVMDARKAISAGDVTPVLKWIAPEDEATIRDVFAKVLKVREASPEARELADRHFFETLVRVHRASEGAPYTGLKPAGTDPGPVVRAADAALDSGSVDTLVEKVTHHVAAGIRQRFTRAKETKAHKDQSVEAGREFVGAYVEFVHYVENLHKAVSAHGEHHAEGPVSGAAEHKHE